MHIRYLLSNRVTQHLKKKCRQAVQSTLAGCMWPVGHISRSHALGSPLHSLSISTCSNPLQWGKENAAIVIRYSLALTTQGAHLANLYGNHKQK